MEEQLSIEELLNIIELQRKALEFYANDKNYYNVPSPVGRDMGHQARFALEQSDVAKNFHKKMVENLDELTKQYEATDPNVKGETNEEMFANMMEKIKELKKLK